MWKLIQLIFLGHWHTWKLIERRDVRNPEREGGILGSRFTLQCTTCGNIKYKNNFPSW